MHNTKLSGWSVSETLLDFGPSHKKYETGKKRWWKVWGYYRERPVISMKKLELTFEKLNSLSTDRAPYMVGLQRGLIAFVKKELHCLSLHLSDLIVCHCIIHHENLCAQSLQLSNVTSIVESCMNFIKSWGLNSHQFKIIEWSWCWVHWPCLSLWGVEAVSWKHAYEVV